MKKSTPIFTMILMLTSLACGGTATITPSNSQPATAEPASLPQATQAAEPGLAATEGPAAEPGSKIVATASAPPGLRVVYLREGNLWAWTEAGGKAQLTDTGDMTAARLSDDGQHLAFVRGGEVWMVRMDGTEARMLVEQASENSALWFAPNGSLLAVSTQDHIDVIDLNTPTANSVLSYPAIPGAYAPEVIWSPDAFGFKTVIPAQAETGLTELLFVFTDGTVASLAKFEMVSLAESLPYLSPDGGYVIYVAKPGEGQEALHLMDSSGATRAYGEPAEDVRALGWLPDSQHFVYTIENSSRSFMGDVMGGSPVEIAATNLETMRWVSAEHFLALQAGELYLGNTNGGKTLIDAGVSAFDFSE